MHINEVRATAFGPFRGSTLKLAPGMNVIYGPNEAGKSTWFAAAYAGLAGRRKARGRGTIAQADFRNRHKPWSGSQWSAGVTLTLDDGLVLALEHDLARGEFRVVDATTGRALAVNDLERRLGLDLTTESTLDGTRLVGLNRDSARATIFTGQADVLRVLEDAEELQQFLERAATTDVADATADGALGWLTERRSSLVGSANVGHRPLRAHTEQLDRARSVTSDRRDQLIRLFDLIRERKGLEAQLRIAKDEVERLDAIAKWDEIRSLRRRAQQAERLLGELATDMPNDQQVDEDRIREATTILAAYDAGADVPPAPEGASAADLAAEIATLPAPPEGDLEPRSEVVAGRERLTRAIAALEAHAVGAPALPSRLIDSETSSDELRRLADLLEVDPPQVDPGLVTEMEAAREAEEQAAANYAAEQQAYEASVQRNEDRRLQYAEAVAEHGRLASEYEMAQADQAARVRAARDSRDAAATRKRRRALALVSGVVVLVSGVAVTLASAPALGIALAVVGLVLAVASIAAGRRSGDDASDDVTVALVPPGPPTTPEWEEVKAPTAPVPDPRVLELQVAVRAQESARDQHRALVASATERLDELSIDPDPAELRSLARAIDDAQAADERRKRHQEQARALRIARDEAASTLANLLHEPAGGEISEEDIARILSATDRYVTACRERAAIAQVANRRPDLTAALEQRRLVESERAQAAVDRERQCSAIVSFVEGLEDRSPDAVESASASAAVLRAWLEKQQELRAEVATRAQLSARLEQVLDGRELQDIQAELAGLIDMAGPEPVGMPDDLEAQRIQAAQRLELLVGRVGALIGQQEQMNQELKPVAEAIEVEAVSERALRGVQSLRSCIDGAAAQLNLAKERAHANIAPALEARIRPLLPAITGGHYLDVAVDPSDLTVRVTEKTGAVRDARLLSHGTMEQIFLLLRIALSQVLSAGEETSPVVLDDVTVQSDQGRTIAILGLLHAVSAERQVVLFTQEQEVVEWARSALATDRDLVVPLGTR